MRNYRLYIQDIIESAEKILRYTDELDFDNFVKNNMVYDAVIRNFEIIGEAARNIPEEIIAGYPEIPWSDMVGMRKAGIFACPQFFPSPTMPIGHHSGFCCCTGW